MIIAEFTMNHPVFREPLRRVPGVEVTWEQTIDQIAGPTQMVVWIDCEDFDAFDDALAADPGSTNPVVLSEPGGRRLYRVDLTEEGRTTNLIPKIVEVGGVLQKAVGKNDGWWCRVRLPDREGLAEVYDFCRANDVEFTFHRLYEQSDWAGGEGPRLTDAQREILVEAVESGYLGVPRDATLEELAERVGISDTAASERFRRAVRNLVEGTVAPEAT